MSLKILGIFLFISFFLVQISWGKIPFQSSNLKQTLAVFPTHILTSTVPQSFSKKLHLNSCAYFTNVNFAQETKYSKVYKYSLIPLSISLYTNYSYIVAPSAENCDGLRTYDCSPGKVCQITQKRVTRDDPFVHLEGNMTYFQINLDKHHLGGSQVPFLYVDKCMSNHSDNFSNPVYGSLALGADGENKDIFRQEPSFSLYLSSDGKQAELIFGLDPSKIANHSKMTLFYSTNNWEIPIAAQIKLNSASENVNLTSNSTSFTGAIIFNLNACYIGFPPSIFALLLEWLSEFGLKCSPQNDQESIPYTCKYEDSPLNLPSISILDTLDESMIKIGPEMYLTKTETSTYDLQIVPLNSNTTNEGFLKTQGSENIIMLGVPYLKLHYIYFGRESTNSVIIYYSKNVELKYEIEEEGKTSEDQGDSGYFWYIVLGVCLLAAVFASVLLVLLWKQSRVRKPPLLGRGVQTIEEDSDEALSERLYMENLQKQSRGIVIHPSKFKLNSRNNL